MECLVNDIVRELWKRLDPLSFDALACTCIRFNALAWETSVREDEVEDRRQYYLDILDTYHDCSRPRLFYHDALDAFHGRSRAPTPMEVRFLAEGYPELVRPSILDGINTFDLFQLNAHESVRKLFEEGKRPLFTKDLVIDDFAISEERQLLHYVARSKYRPEFLLWLLRTVSGCDDFVFDSDNEHYTTSLLKEVVHHALFGPIQCDALVAIVRDETTTLGKHMTIRMQDLITCQTLEDKFIEAIENGRYDTVRWMWEKWGGDALSNTPYNLTFYDGHPKCDVSNMLQYLFQNGICTFDVEDIIAICLYGDEEVVARELAVLDNNMASYRGFNFLCSYHLKPSVLFRVTLEGYLLLSSTLERFLSNEDSEEWRIDWDAVMLEVDESIGSFIIGYRRAYALLEYLIKERRLPLDNWPVHFFSDRPLRQGKDEKYFRLLYEHAEGEWERFIQDKTISLDAKFNITRRSDRTIIQVADFIRNCGISDSALTEAEEGHRVLHDRLQAAKMHKRH